MPFICPKCNKNFRDNCDLSRHLLRKKTCVKFNATIIKDDLKYNATIILKEIKPNTTIILNEIKPNTTIKDNIQPNTTIKDNIQPNTIIKDGLSSNIQNMGIIYLLKTREFVNSNQNIFKIGMSSKLGDNRTKQYPKGSVVYLIIAVSNPNLAERKLIDIFSKEFIQKKEYGNEYFEGDITKMKNIIFNEEQVKN